VSADGARVKLFEALFVVRGLHVGQLLLHRSELLGDSRTLCRQLLQTRTFDMHVALEFGSFACNGIAPLAPLFHCVFGGSQCVFG